MHTAHPLPPPPPTWIRFFWFPVHTTTTTYPYLLCTYLIPTITTIPLPVLFPGQVWFNLACVFHAHVSQTLPLCLDFLPVPPPFLPCVHCVVSHLAASPFTCPHPALPCCLAPALSYRSQGLAAPTPPPACPTPTHIAYALFAMPFIPCGALGFSPSPFPWFCGSPHLLPYPFDSYCTFWDFLLLSLSSIGFIPPLFSLLPPTHAQLAAPPSWCLQWGRHSGGYGWISGREGREDGGC